MAPGKGRAAPIKRKTGWSAEAKAGNVRPVVPRKQKSKVEQPAESRTLTPGLALLGAAKVAHSLRGHRVIVAAKLFDAALPGSPVEEKAREYLHQMLIELETLEEAAAARPEGPPAPYENTKLGKRYDKKPRDPKAEAGDMPPRKPPRPLPTEVVEDLERLRERTGKNAAGDKLTKEERAARPPRPKQDRTGNNVHEKLVSGAQAKEIVRLYTEEFIGAAGIEQRTGCSKKSVMTALARAGVKLRRPGWVDGRNPAEQAEKEAKMVEAYLAGVPHTRIIRENKSSYDVLCRALAERGIEFKSKDRRIAA